MTYRTHREFAVVFVLIANIVIYKLGLSKTNYFINMAVMLLFGKQGALFPDVDHTWQNVKEKTVINKVINVIIHMTGGTHRSWQTHSWDIWLASLIGVLYINSRLSYEDSTVFIVIIMGFWLGWFSHLFSDMLTSGGVRILCISKKTTVSIVPKHANLVTNAGLSTLVTVLGALMWWFNFYKGIGLGLIIVGIVLLGISFKIGDMKFNTGGAWEQLVYNTTVKINIAFTIFALCYPTVEKYLNF